MHTFLMENMEHLVAIGILLGRIGDVTTTYLGSPKLKLESNPVVRKLRWPLAAATLLLCIVPYFDMSMGIMLMVLFFLVCLSNSLRLWLIRALGEDEYFQLLVNAAGKANYRSSLILNFVPGIFMSLLAIGLLIFYPDPENNGYWFAYGILSYAVITMIYFPKNFIRLRKLALKR